MELKCVYEILSVLELWIYINWFYNENFRRVDIMSWEDIHVTPESVHNFLESVDIESLAQNVEDYFEKKNEKNKLQALNKAHDFKGRLQFNSTVKGSIHNSIPTNTKFENLSLDRKMPVA